MRLFLDSHPKNCKDTLDNILEQQLELLQILCLEVRLQQIATSLLVQMHLLIRLALKLK
jgi:hypothetical protein